MKNNARKYVLEILTKIEEKKAFSNIAIHECLRNKELSSKDRGLVTEIVYGVLENKIYLDYIIHTLSKVKGNKIDQKVRNILRMGLYQMIFLDKIPQFAAVSESVNLTKSVNFKAKGFVNAILRNYLRTYKDGCIKEFKNNPIKDLSITYSYPEWMIKKFMDLFGYDFTKNLLKANHQRPSLCIRTNTLKISKKELIIKLSQEGIQCFEDTFVEEALHIKGMNHIENTLCYQEGLFQIQDQSSMLVAHVLDPKPGEKILDICAAPGGKSTHIAQKMKNKGWILARDIYAHKLKLIENNAKRLGIDIIKTQKQDATKLDVECIEKMDKVLVDAPCSGLGIIRRKPELKYNKTQKDIENLKNIQWSILENSSQYVKKGGILVYSTCTILEEENKCMIEKFLQKHEEYELIDIHPYLPDTLKSKEKMLQLYPNVHGTDGFFISKMKKRG